MAATLAAADRRIARVVYRALLRDAGILAREGSAVRLVPPVNAAGWGQGCHVEDAPASHVQAALFSGVDFAGAGHGERTDFDGAAVRDVVRHCFRQCPSTSSVDAALAHLATLHRLRAAEADSSLTRTTFGDTVAVDVELTTQFLRMWPDSLLLQHRAFPFAYRIRISNRGSDMVQLVGRHWVFTDSSGSETVVPRFSSGVVGHSPVLEPGQSFEYVSGTQLRAPNGTMQGSFQMVVGTTGTTFDAMVARTRLSGPSDLSQAAAEPNESALARSGTGTGVE